MELGGVGLERGASERCLRAVWGEVSGFWSEGPGELYSKEGPPLSVPRFSSAGWG